MRLPLVRGRLWRHPDFLKLWAGETVSRFGTQVSLLAIPTVAILVLHAGPYQVGLLSALEFLAFPVLGLVAGVYADRLRRRPILIASDLGRAATLGSIPIAFALHALTLEQLYAVALLTGVFTVFFDVAYQSYLPALIDRSDLVEGNTKLTVSESAAQIGGPPLAGFLIQLIGGARAVGADAVSYLVSALAVWAIRKPEPEPKPGTESGQTGFFAEMREGIGVVFRNSILWHIAGSTATSNLGSNIVYGAVFLPFLYRILHLAPAEVGVIFGISSVGFLVGAMLATNAVRWLGVGWTLVVSIAAPGLFTLANLAAMLGSPVVVLVLAGFFGWLIGAPYNITQVSLRQAITPDRVQGRMNATVRAIVWGTIPIGAILGGILGSNVGIIQTIIIGGVVSTLAVVWILVGPVIQLKEQPTAVTA